MLAPREDVPALSPAAIGVVPPGLRGPDQGVLDRRKLDAERRKEENEALRPYRDWLSKRFEERTRPVEAVTLQPVAFEVAPVKRRQRKLLETASKFKGTRFIGEMLAMAPAQEAEPAAPAVDAHRWRMIAELERARRAVPITWSALDVDLWLQAAYETLYRAPVKIWPKEYGNCMPTPTDFRDLTQADINAQTVGRDEEDDVPALFGLARLRTLGMPDKFEIERMYRAIEWPTLFLMAMPDVARIVGHAAMWKALDVSFTGEGFKKLCRRKFKLWPEQFDRLRGAGLTVIAGGLNASTKKPSR